MYDYEKAVEHCESLEKFEGYVPCLLRPAPFNNLKYYENLKKNGLYDEVVEKTDETRHYTFEEKMNELVDFVKNHPEYSDVIVE